MRRITILAAYSLLLLMSLLVVCTYRHDKGVIGATGGEPGTNWGMWSCCGFETVEMENPHYYPGEKWRISSFKIAGHGVTKAGKTWIWE
jgi:hypothetical protein